MKNNALSFSKIFLLFLTILAIVGGVYYFLTAKNMNTETRFLPAQEWQKQGWTGTDQSRAYFAGGCFWCMEGIFESQVWVTEAISGYAGGSEVDASYEKVGAGLTRHREAVEVIYDPKIISYERLIELYFTQIDPTQADGQFADRGYHYTTAIYTQTEEEKKIASEYVSKLDNSKKFDKPIAVKVEDFTTFFPAEEYHL
jgi:methionine-S-sulfoxide reductase